MDPSAQHRQEKLRDGPEGFNDGEVQRGMMVMENKQDGRVGCAGFGWEARLVILEAQAKNKLGTNRYHDTGN